MKTPSRLLVPLTCLSAALALAGPASAEPVLQMLEVRVEGDPGEYLRVMRQLDDLSREVSPKVQIRVWRALLAGEASGRLVIMIEHPSLEHYAAHRTKLQAHEGWARLLAKARDTGRERVSNALLAEVQP